MINVDLTILNPLEKKIHDTLIRESKGSDNLRINEAAVICGCSVSKISKFTKKLGFANYKQYLDFLYGRDLGKREHSDELIRIEKFIKNFDDEMVNELISLIDCHEKIVLFGYGPSLLCAEYFEYRFRNCADKTTMAFSDEVALKNMVDKSTLLILITETGRFHSFQDVYSAAKQKGGTVVIIVEEYNTELFNQCDKIFWLSPDPQPAHLKPYEKSRTLFFIFLEEIIQKFLHRKKDFQNE